MDISVLQWIYDFYDGYIIFTIDITTLTMDISVLQWISSIAPTKIQPNQLPYRRHLNFHGELLVFTHKIQESMVFLHHILDYFSP